MVLPDTSVWVAHLRLGERGPAAALDDLPAGARPWSRDGDFERIAEFAPDLALHAG